eukprot:TRINITY_DN32834_c0_g1_i1.p1 TRINITY_DN32834_c0_g1~~TRINITY_DN32834_c0_g1_i1.p1  ORF type:complete len:832 (+),score=182.52 TRINITY_DN32834_c0_g1_i1:186-2681(+)
MSAQSARAFYSEDSERLLDVEDSAGAEENMEEGSGEESSSSSSSSEDGLPCPTERRKLRWQLLAIGIALVAGIVVALVLILTRRTKKITVPPFKGYCEARREGHIQMPVANATAEERETWATDMVGRMSSEEKFSLVKGVGFHGYSPDKGFYIGNTWAVPRLAIPSLRIQDAGQGFRTYVPEVIDEVTTWPCSLAMAASWDADAVDTFVTAMSKEFSEKGANVLLGPGVNVHRVPRNGRNAEYISGEDPRLGAVLTAAYVKAAQKAGMVSVVKHFVLNNQETNRNRVNSIASNRTLWELYYQPFAAAVDAGVGAVMCSYNYVNGKQSCANDETINHDLKGVMGFRGWVMSDWWALRNGDWSAKGGDAVEAGTDQEMPGKDGYFKPDMPGLTDARLDNMAHRVLFGMSAAKGVLTEEPKCRVGCDCDELIYNTNVATVQHRQLARELAAGSAVLLKNSFISVGADSEDAAKPVLPLRKGYRVTVVGSACFHKPDVETMVKSKNWMSGSYYFVGGSGRVLTRNSVSVWEGLQDRGFHLAKIETDDIALANSSMDSTDIFVTCGGATASENRDRDTLLLDQDDFISKLTEEGKRTKTPVVVIALAPGAIVMPWQSAASAILVMFLAGQETGSAVGDILEGVVDPAGRLPVTMPLALEAVGAQPCEHRECEYSEGVSGGWHEYDGKPVAFAFGEGRSYTSFGLEPVSGKDDSCLDAIACLALRVTNVGEVFGQEVIQLYVAFPAEAQMPPLNLRGFRKTKSLAPGQSELVEFTLSKRDASTWDPATASWRLVEGNFTAVLATSSRQCRYCAGFHSSEKKGALWLGSCNLASCQPL